MYIYIYIHTYMYMYSIENTMIGNIIEYLDITGIQATVMVMMENDFTVSTKGAR